MAYYEQIYNTATPALDIMTSLQTWMPANGYVFVETFTSATDVSDVYRSPGTLNSFGTNFFIAFNRTSTTATTVAVMIFEQWDAALKRAVKYAPFTNSASTTPAGDGTMNDAGVALNATAVAASCHKSTVMGATVSVSTTIYINITVDRLIWGNSNSANIIWAGYAGLYDSFTPGGFPLISVSTGYQTITLPTSTAYGSVTREPWISAATTNFGVYSGTYSNGSQYAWPINSSVSASSINGRTGLYPTSLVSFRSTKNTSVGGIYGTLKDIVYNNQGLVNGTGGDTLAITVGATTYNYVKPATNSSYGPLFWIPKQ